MHDAVMALAPAPAPVTLLNCDREPIHIPERIQPHGVLLAFDDAGRLRAWSANVGWLSDLPPGTLTRRLLAWPETVDALVDEVSRAGDVGGPGTRSTSVDWRGQVWDVVAHRHAGRLLVEFEKTPPGSAPRLEVTLGLHRVFERLRHARAIPDMLALVTQELRAMTGFDRVMAYRFRADESGEVVAEAHAPALRPLLGMRYPASDIPAQARRLYTLNTLRLIADIDYEPVPLCRPPGEAPLDMSHAVLRSVSPVHVEYLRNMGVRASMSVSIVVDGRLWGLLACHHNAPLQVPHAVRLGCDLMAQVLSATVQGLEAAGRAAALERAAGQRDRLAAALEREDDWLAAVRSNMPALAALLSADALLVRQGDRLERHGPLPDDVMAAVLASLPPASSAPLVRQCRTDWPEGTGPRLGPWVGLLGLGIAPEGSDWLLALRQEQVQSVRWAGKPEKILVTGPLGQRLTPRGSFEEWHATVRDQAEPWEDTTLQADRLLLAELRRAELQRHAEVERARARMLATVSHDLREPLNSIRMAAQLLERTGGPDASVPQRVGARIRASSSRMQAMVDELLDFTRLQHGLGLNLAAEATDLVAIVRDLIDEMRQAHPDLSITADLPTRSVVQGDPGRLAQAFGNLLSNARQHGRPAGAIRVTIIAGPGTIDLAVSNPGEAIPADQQESLFTPFKTSSGARPHGGLGMGLYIAHAIATSHGGTLLYAYQAPDVVFRMTLPAVAPLAP